MRINVTDEERRSIVSALDFQANWCSSQAVGIHCSESPDLGECAKLLKQESALRTLADQLVRERTPDSRECAVVMFSDKLVVESLGDALAAILGKARGWNAQEVANAKVDLCRTLALIGQQVISLCL